MEATHQRRVKRSRGFPIDCNISEEKRKFDQLSKVDKLDYLEQALRAQQIFDCTSYDLAAINKAKIQQGSVTSITGLRPITNANQSENFSNVILSLNRTQENTT